MEEMGEGVSGRGGGEVGEREEEGEKGDGGGEEEGGD